MLRCACVGRGRHVAEEHGNTLARDGLATLEWIERYLERVRELPCWRRSSRARSARGSRSTRPSTASRSRTCCATSTTCSCRADALAEPAVLRLLRDVRLGAGDPRRAPRGRAQQRRDPLADLACAPGARAGDARVARGAARPPRRLARPDRGRRLDLDDRRARCGAPGTARRPVVVCSEHAHSSVEKACRLLGLEVRKTPADEAFRLRPDALDLTDACAVVATVGHHVVHLGRPRRADR